MMDYETFCTIKKLHDQDGLNCAQIAKELGIDSCTVRNWVAEQRYRPRKTYLKSSILDSFKPEINRMLEKHAYTARQVYQQLQELNYEGSYNTVKGTCAKYVRGSRRPI